MSNTPEEVLNHTFKATLIVDLDGRTQEIDLPDYPQEYVGVDGECRVGIPTPTALEYGGDNWGGRHNLYTDEEVYSYYQHLERKVDTILQAAVVNEKQRKALSELVHDTFTDAESALWSPRH